MYIGIDIGSTKVAIVIMDKEKNVLGTSISPTKENMNKSGVSALSILLDEVGLSIKDIKAIVATGYGRKLVKFPVETIEIPEIIAIAMGAKWMYGGARTIIDIGGQDSKVLSLDNNGTLVDFRMNDICAAGTGRFIENMARVLDVKLDKLGEMSMCSDENITLSSVCAVFAESEVISLMSQGVKKENIIAGLHQAIAMRVGKLAHMMGVIEPVVFTGGVAKNVGVKNSLEDVLGVNVNIPNSPQLVAAYGAVLRACENV